MAERTGQPEDKDDEHEPERHDRAAHEDDGPKELRPVPTLLVDRKEPADRAIDPEGHERLTKGHEREGVGERPVRGRREIADDQDLDQEVDHHGDHAAEEQQARAADVASRRAQLARVGGIRGRHGGSRLRWVDTAATVGPADGPTIQWRTVASSPRPLMGIARCLRPAAPDVAAVTSARRSR
jgi:hypothetical protein